MRVNNGIDFQARSLGGDKAGETGTATASSTTSLTNSGATFPTAGAGVNKGYAGHVVIAWTTGVCGRIITNTGTVLTIDHWFAPATPDVVATTPSATTGYTITSGQVPAWFMGLTENSNAADATDIMLSTTAGGSTNAELWVASAGLNRALCTWAHTAAVTSYTLSKTFTANANDAPPKTPAKVGVFAHNVTAAPTSSTAGTLFLETAIGSPPAMLAGDQLTVTHTVNI